MTKWSAYLYYGLPLLLRLLVIWAGLFMQNPPRVSMTDIDYLVISDGICRTVSSVYERPTFRYSPLLRFCMPFLCTHQAVGKITLALYDTVNVLVLVRIADGVLTRKGLSHCSKIAKRVVFVMWSVNPFVIAMSTRGSFDTVSQLPLLLSLAYLINNNSHLMSAAFMALAINLRLYPVIYFPIICAYMLCRHLTGNSQAAIWKQLFLGLCDALKWTLMCFGVYALLLLMSVSLDPEYLNHGILYHQNRVDHRHNISLLWPVMLRCSQDGEFCSVVTAVHVMQLVIPVLCSARLILSVVLSLWRQRQLCPGTLERDVIHFLVVSTASFITLNTVLTMQYYIWVISLYTLDSALLSYQSLTARRLCQGVGALLVHLGPLVAHLCFAYLLEFRTLQVGYLVSASSIAHAFLVFNLIRRKTDKSLVSHFDMNSPALRNDNRQPNSESQDAIS